MSTERNSVTPPINPDEVKPIASADQNRDLLRTTVRDLQELELSRIYWIKNYLRLLQTPSNRQHFTNVPASLEDFVKHLSQSGVHPYAAINVLGKPVGYGTIYDAEPMQHDHFLGKVVIRNDMQSAFKGKGPHVGGQMLEKLMEEGFTTKAHDGRERLKLSAAVVIGVKNYERAINLFQRHGFKLAGYLETQADVVLPEGMTVTRNVMRLEQTRRDWEVRRYFHNNPPTAAS